MSKVERFEDLKCWQEARVLVKEIYSHSNQGDFARDYDLRSQIRRAAISVMNNISDGFGRFSRKEFIRFLEMSATSASEVKSVLYVALDLGYLGKTEVEKLQDHSEKIKSMNLALIKYLNSKK